MDASFFSSDIISYQYILQIGTSLYSILGSAFFFMCNYTRIYLIVIVVDHFSPNVYIFYHSGTSEREWSSCVSYSPWGDGYYESLLLLSQTGVCSIAILTWACIPSVAYVNKTECSIYGYSIVAVLLLILAIAYRGVNFFW